MKRVFVDGSVLIAAVGPACPERETAQRFFLQSLAGAERLVTSTAAVLEALVVSGREDLVRGNRVLTLTRDLIAEVWPLHIDDVDYADQLRYKFPDLDHASLIKLAATWRRNVDRIETLDPRLRRAVDAGGRGTRRTGRERARASQEAWKARREAEDAAGSRDGSPREDGH